MPGVLPRRAVILSRVGRRPLLVCAAVGAAAGGLWLLAILVALEGTYALPLERSYLLLADARELADGDLPPAERGVLWQVLLVPGASTAGGAHAHLWVAVLSVVLLACTAAASGWLGGALAGPDGRVAALGLTLLNGWFLYSSLAGTEASLVALALLVAAGGFATGRLAVASFALAALALTTPWGAIVAVVGAVALGLTALRPFRPDRLWLLAPPFAGAAIAARSGLAPLLELDPGASVFRRPDLTVPGRISQWLGDASSGVSSLAVADARFLVPVAFAAAALVGGGMLWTRNRPAALVVTSAVVAAVLAAATTGWGTDNARVLSALLPVVAVAATVGITALPIGARRPAALALLVLTALPAAGWLGDAMNAASQIGRVQLPFARETAATAAPGSRIAVDRPGLLSFYADVTLDLSGRETPALREAARGGLGGVWEALERVREDRRPDLLAISLDRVPGLGPTGIVGRPFVERRIPYEEAREPDTTHVLTLYAADWEPLRRAEQAHGEAEGTTASTVVDVGDVVSERRARYERAWSVRAPDRSAEVPLVTRRAAEDDDLAVSEGCRLVVREAFDLELGRDAALVARFDGTADVAVHVDGRLVGSLRVSPPPETFGYARLDLPGHVGTGRIELVSRSGEAYTSCRYWLVA